VLHQLSHAEGDYDICCLVREGKVDVVKDAYLDIRVVQGSLDDVALLEEEARKADVVIREFTLRLAVSELTVDRCCWLPTSAQRRSDTQGSQGAS
jgi:hypothetical protein